MLNRLFSRTPRRTVKPTADDIHADICTGIKHIAEAFNNKLVPEGTDVIEFNYRLGMSDANAALSKAAVHQLAILAWKNAYIVTQYRRAISELAKSLNAHSQDFPNLNPFIKEWNTIYEGIAKGMPEAETFYEEMAAELLLKYANDRAAR